MTTLYARRAGSPVAVPLPGFPLELIAGDPESADLQGASGIASTDAESMGLELIQASNLVPETKQRYSLEWRRWVSYFHEQGVSPLPVTAEQALGWVRSRDWQPTLLHRHRYAVNHVYRAMGLPSPLQEPQVLREVLSRERVDGTEIGFGDAARTGFQLIQGSDLATVTKRAYASVWRKWVSFFDDQGVEPLLVPSEQAQSWVRSQGWTTRQFADGCHAVNYVFRGMGLPSPLQELPHAGEASGATGTPGTDVVSGGSGWDGDQLIQASNLVPRTKREYSSTWIKWVGHFQAQGVDPLGVPIDEAQSWVLSQDWTPRQVRNNCHAVNYVLREMGFSSPLQQLPHAGDASGATGAPGTDVMSGGAGRAGCQLIQASRLLARTKQSYLSYWRKWVGYCQQAGLSPLGPTAEEALGWVHSRDWTRWSLTEALKALNFVFRGMSLPSPLTPAAVMRKIFGEPAVQGRAALYGDAGWSGVNLIQASSLAAITKRRCTLAWRKWVAYFDERGIAPLNVTDEEALDWVRSRDWKPWQLAEARHGVSFVFEGMGFQSPLQRAPVVREIRGVNGGGEAGGELCERVLAQRRLRIEDYLLWCQRNGKAALPGSGQQVAEFLLFLSDGHGHSAIKDASVGVSRYLEDNGSASVTTHPAVRVALKECRARIEARGNAGPREVSAWVPRVRSPYQSAWLDWCEGASIEWQKAEPVDALRYLRGLEYQRSAWQRVFQLSKLYEGMIDPFSDESVLEWKRWHIQAGGDGTLPQWSRGDATAELIERIRSARSAARTVVPVGLTVEDLQGVDYDVSGQCSEGTLRGYAAQWVRFESWLCPREIPLDAVVGLHVAVFLKEFAEGRRVGTVVNMLKALVYVFREFGVADNPALSPEVEQYIMKLTRQRKESQSQVSPFREDDYQAIVANAGREVARELPKRAQNRSALEPAAFGLMFDAMLRVQEAAEARWENLSRHDDGSGMLLIAASKTDQFGEGAYVYVSHRTMASLDRLREVQRTLGKPHSGSDRIFGVGAAQLATLLKAAARAIGFEGQFGTHSMRIGMAQELATAGFGLVLIMLAGRWENPGMPARYIRKLKLPEGAVARLFRARDAGLTRVNENEMGSDVLATYDSIRFEI